jgi:hypothetical protein
MAVPEVDVNRRNRMLRNAGRLFCPVALCLAALGVIGQEKKSEGQTYYPLEVGNAWRYVNNIGNESLTRVVRREKVGNEEGFRLETSVSNQVVSSEVLVVRADGIYRLKANDVPIEPPVPVLKWPAKAKDSWEVKAKVKDKTIEGKLSITATDEKVATRAGEFACLKVSGENLQLGGQKLSATYWYAPGMGPVKVSIKIGEQETSLELVEFTRSTGSVEKAKP